MIAIARKNLFHLLLSPNSVICNSNVHFSTSRLKRIIPSPEIYDVLVHKHNFSPELAALAVSRFPLSRSPESVDSLISFLKRNKFTTTQLERIVIYKPLFLGVNVEGIEFRLKLFLDLGISSEEISKMVMGNMGILYSSMENRIIPSLSLLKGLLPSNQEVARLLRKSAWFVTSDLKTSLLPNLEILKNCGVPVDRRLHFLFVQPRCFLVKPVVMKKSVEKVVDIGVSWGSNAFIQAVCLFSCSSEGIWETKLQTLRDLGFSDNEIFRMFRKAPLVFFGSTKRMKNVIEFLLANGKYSISDIVKNPTSLGYNIENRLEPRLQIIRLLESRKLIEKWPGLSTVTARTDDKFFDRFIRPYMDEIGKEYIIEKYLEGRKR